MKSWIPIRIWLLAIFFFTSFGQRAIYAQFTVVTSPPLTANNGQQGVTFELSTNADIIITGFANTFNTGAQTAEIWYRIGGVQHATGTAPNISTANGWVMLANNISVTGNNTTPVPIPGNFSLNIPANTDVGFFIGGGMRYQTHAGPPDQFSDATITIKTGTNFGYGGGIPSPTFHPRQFLGSVTYEFAAPCTAPPAAGNATAAATDVCVNTTTDLSLSNNSTGLGQTYQWQSSLDNITWTNIPGATSLNHTITVIDTAWYRCLVTCSTQTATSTPVQVNAVGSALSGTYTINQFAAPSATNFETFTDFVQALTCGGVSGPVIANVVPGTGPYNEQILFEAIGGASATNTVTINGNGNWLTFLSTNTSERYTLAMDGTEYLTIDSLNIEAQGTTTTEFGWGIWMTNGAAHNTVKNCSIVVDTGSTSLNYAAFVSSGTPTSATTTLASPISNNTIENNTIIGGYYGVTLNGMSAAVQGQGNKFLNNTVTNWRLYGFYFRAQDGLEVKGNDVTRGNRSFTTNATFYGMYFITGFTNCEIVGNRIYNSCGNCNSGNTSLQYGIYMSGASGSLNNENLMANNLIHDLNSEGTTYAIYVFTNNFWKYYHNHIILDNANSGTNVWGFYSSGSTPNSEFMNNIISVDRSGTNVLGYNFPTANNGLTANYNAIYVPNGNVGRSGTTDYSTLNDWQTGTNNDLNSIEAPGLFVDPANFDYTPGTPAYHQQGTNLQSTVPTDFFGATRGTTPDLGAIEYTPMPCSGPFGFGNDSLTPTSGFFTWDSYENNWVIEWGPVGFVPGSGAGTQVPTTNNNSFEVTGFVTETCYDIWVAEVCGPGDTSTWTGPLTICTPKAHDAAILGIVNPEDRDCGSASTPVEVEIRNLAYFPITSLPITVEISGALTQTLNFTYTGNLMMDQSTVVTVGNVDLSDGGIIDIHAFVSLPNDQDSTNDNVNLDSVRIVPAEPKINNLSFCAGDDSVTLYGTYLPQLVAYGWYDAATGGTLLSNADTITVAASALPNIWLGYDSVANTAGNRNYCTSEATSTGWGYIQSVNFAGINQVSPTTCQTYTDYTDSATAIVTPGNSYPITIDVQGCSGGNWTHSTKVFIDLNGNGDFTDPGEEVFVESPHQYGIVTGTITIPASATPGLTTTMRVITVETGAAANVNPCGTFTWGETEDYTIEILGAVACSPNRTQANVTADSVPTASYTYTILPNLEVEFISTSTPAGVNASWDFGGLGTATGDTVRFTFPQTDTFSVCLTVSNFCATDNSCEDINVFGIGVDNYELANLRIFPNPSEGRFKLSFTQDYVGEVTIDLLDLTGKVVSREVNKNFSGNYSKEFDYNNLASGSYLLRINTAQGTTTRRVVINK
jgi:hypothetical protein